MTDLTATVDLVRAYSGDRVEPYSWSDDELETIFIANFPDLWECVAEVLEASATDVNRHGFAYKMVDGTSWDGKAISAHLLEMAKFYRAKAGEPVGDWVPGVFDFGYSGKDNTEYEGDD